jgi:hypothetical protein
VLGLASTVSLGLGSRRIHDHILALSRLLRVLKWGLHFSERRGLITTGRTHVFEPKATRMGDGKLFLLLPVILQPHHGQRIDSASNRNEYQESSWE